MLDSVTLLINFQDFKILHPNRFHPDPFLVYQHQIIKSVANSTKQDFLEGNYLPKLTLSRRKNLDGKSEVMLTIEASLPKIMFNNNLEELQTKDFYTVISKLQEKLLLMGVEVSIKALKSSAVTSIHYSKNIVLKDGSTPFHYLQQIEKGIISTQLDANTTNYRGGGHVVKWHCNSYEIVLYDKLYDLLKHQQQGKKRSIDTDNFLDFKKIEKRRTKKKRFEVLRIEARLNKRIMIKNLFKKLKIKNNLTLQQLCKSIIMKKVLGYYINTIVSKRPIIHDIHTLTKQQLLSSLIVHNSQISPRNLLSYIGYTTLLQEFSQLELQRLFKPKDKSNLQRLFKEFSAISLPTSKHDSFDIILKQIKSYKPLQL